MNWFRNVQYKQEFLKDLEEEFSKEWIPGAILEWNPGGIPEEIFGRIPKGMINVLRNAKMVIIVLFYSPFPSITFSYEKR